MTNKEMERKLQTAMAHAAPDRLEAVLSACGGEKGTVIPMKVQTGKNRWLPMAGLAAMLTLLIAAGAFGLGAWQRNAVACVVSLDVNPSIELKVNRQERVLSCTPLNGDAMAVLFEMDGGADLEGAKLDVAVNAVVGALVRHGYLDSISSALLISVEDRDQARADRLQAELTGSVAALLEQESAAASVYGQSVAQDAELDRLAQANSISPGKALLVNRVLALKESLSFEKLAALSVEELNQLVNTGAPGMPIGVAQARYLAEEYAGRRGVPSLVEPELDDDIPHYEVEIYTYFEKYEYEVDAYTGVILSGTPNIPERPASDEPPSTEPNPISSQEAQNIALEHMAKQYPELEGQSVLSLAVWTEREDGRKQYKVEFYCGGYEFEYEISGSGQVRDWEAEHVGPPTHPAQTQTPAPAQSPTPAPSPAPSPASSPAPSPAPSQSAAPVQTIPPIQNIPPNQPLPDPPDPGLSRPGYGIGDEAAIAAAYAHAGCAAEDVTYVTCKLDRDDGCYELEFVCGDYEYEYEIDCYTGAVIKHSCERHGSSGGHHSSTHHGGGSDTYIGQSAALSAAYGHAGVSASDASEVKAELEWEGGRMIYEVEFRVGRTEYEYEIDASTGEVLSWESELDD